MLKFNIIILTIDNIHRLMKLLILMLNMKVEYKLKIKVMLKENDAIGTTE